MFQNWKSFHIDVGNKQLISGRFYLIWHWGGKGEMSARDF